MEYGGPKDKAQAKRGTNITGNALYIWKLNKNTQTSYGANITGNSPNRGRKQTKGAINREKTHPT